MYEMRELNCFRFCKGKKRSLRLAYRLYDFVVAPVVAVVASVATAPAVVAAVVASVAVVAAASAVVAVVATA